VRQAVVHGGRGFNNFGAEQGFKAEAEALPPVFAYLEKVAPDAGGFLIGIEALLIGQRFGLDPAVMVEVLNASTGKNNSTEKKFGQYVLSRGFNAGFGLDLMVKDLTTALEVAREGGTPAPFAAQCRELWAAAAAMLGPGRDHTELARLSEALAGTELRPG